MKLYKLNIKNDYKVQKKLVNFLNPEYACAFLKNYDEVSNIKYVYKNKLLEESNLESYSSISGSLTGFVNIQVNGKNKKALFIKNDFKESDKKVSHKKVKNQEEFKELIKKSKFSKIFNKIEIKNLVINGIKDEPFVLTESFILKNSSDKLIEVISYLNELFSFDNSLIVFKNKENENVKEYLSKAKTYPFVNILLLDDLYLLEKDEVLLNNLKLSMNNTIVLKPSELLELRYFLKYNTYMSEKYISVVDTINKKIRFVFLKKNIIASELLNKLNLLNSDYEYFKNGGINGIIINENKEIITNDFDSLFIVKKEKTSEKKCINCGKCVSVCPYGVNPKKMYENNKIDPRCIKCGLCTLMCPSDILLTSGGKK